MAKENATPDPVVNDEDMELREQEEEALSASKSAYRLYDEYEAGAEKQAGDKELSPAEALRTLIGARKPQAAKDAVNADALVPVSRTGGVTDGQPGGVSDGPPGSVKDATDGKEVKTPAEKAAVTDVQNLQEWLLSRFDTIKKDGISPLLTDRVVDYLKASYETLPPDLKKQLQGVFSDPAKAQVLAQAFIRDQLKNAANALAGGDISDEDLDKMRQAVDRGELPPALVKQWLEREKNNGEFGPLTAALYAGMVNSLRGRAGDVAADAILNGRPLPADGGPTIPVRDNVPNPTAPQIDEILSGKAPLGPRLDASKIPTANDLADLKKIESWMDAAKAPANFDLDRMQSFLENKIEKLGPARLFEAVKNQRVEQLREMFDNGKLPDHQMDLLRKAKQEGKLDQALHALAEQQIKQVVQAHLDKQVTLGAMTPAQRDLQKELLNKGLIDNKVMLDLVKREQQNHVNGCFTRGAMAAYTQDLQERVPATMKRMEASNTKLPADGPAAPIPSPADKLDLGPALAGKVPTAQEFAQFREKVEKAEKWLDAVGKLRNQDVDRVQKAIVDFLPTIDRDAVFDQLKVPVKAQVEQQIRDGVLSPEEKSLITGKQGDEYDKKVNEIVEARVKKMLAAEVDRLVKSGEINADMGKVLADAVSKGAIPNEVLMGLLMKEVESNTYGPMTKALWTATVETYEKRTGEMLVRLGANKLPIPPECPIKVGLNSSGRPEMMEAFQADVQTGARWQSGINPQAGPPKEADIKRLIQAVKWNQEAGVLYADKEQGFKQQVLEETVVQLGKRNWLPKDGMDRQQWFAAVTPLVDLTREVKGCAQALALAKRFSGSNAINFSPTALGADFPGKIKTDKDGRITELHIDLPDDLTPSYENRQKIERLQKWLAANREAAQQCMKQLAEAAADSGAILMWTDMPVRGKVPGTPTDYNLQKHRFSVEEMKDKDGQPIIRVRNRVDYYNSHWYNYQDWGADQVGQQFYKTQDKDNKECDYRDYKPTDMVVVMKDGKAQLIMAKDLQKFADGEQRMQNFEKGLNVAMDVGMLVCGCVQIGAAMKAARLAAAAGNLAADGVAQIVKREAQAALRSAIRASVKDFTLGGTGLVMNNAEVRSCDLGQFAHKVRNLVFVGDAAYSLFSITKGVAAARGWIGGEKLSAEALKAQEIIKARLNPKWGEIPEDWGRFSRGTHVAGKGSHAFMFGMELVMIGHMSGPTLKELRDNIWEPVRPGSLATANVLYQRIASREGAAQRFLSDMAQNLALTKPELKARFEEIAQLASGASNLPPAEKSKKVQQLMDWYSQTKLEKGKLVPARSQEERVLLAMAILNLSRSADGKFPETIGKSIDRVNRGPMTTFTPQKLFDEIGAGLKSKDATMRMLSGQYLLGAEKLSMPEYATVCRGVLNDAKAPRDTKLQAVLGLSISLDGAMQALKSSGEDRYKAFVQSLGCAPKDIAKTLEDVAAKDQDPEVRAMAASLLHAFSNPDKDKGQAEIASVVAVYTATRADAQVQRLEKELAGDVLPLRRQLLKAQLELRTAERDAAREVLAFLQNPQLKQQLETQQKQRAEETQQAQLRVLSTSRDIKSIEDQLAKPSLGADERTALQTRLDEKKAKLKEQQDLLAKAEAAASKPAIDPATLPHPASVNSFVVDKMIKDLQAPEPDAKDAINHLRWAQMRLQAAHTLDKLGSPDEKRWSAADVSKAFASLVDGKNSDVAIQALEALLPNKIKTLGPEDRQRILANVKEILWSRHNGNTDIERSNAMLKLSLLRLVPSLCDAMGLEKAQRAEFVNVAASLIDPSKGNFAGQYPELRKAAVDALGQLKPDSEAVLELIRLRLKMQGDPTIGEPDASVRLAAFKALDLLQDKKLPELAKLNSINERDPELAARLQALEFKMVRPGVDDRRIFQMEVDYWKGVIDGASARVSLPAGKKHCEDNYKTLIPSHARTAYDAALAGYEEAKKPFKERYESSWNRYVENDYIKDKNRLWNDHILVGYYGNQNKIWKKLCDEARLPDENGAKARAALMYLCNECGDSGSNYAVPAAKELAKLAKMDPPVFDIALLVPQMTAIMTTIQGDDNRRHKVCQELLGIMEDLHQRKLVSDEVLGRAAHDILRTLLDKAHLDKVSVNDPRKTEQILRLLEMMKSTGYPLAMDLLIGLSERKTTSNLPEVAPAVTAKATQILGQLRRTAPLSSQSINERANVLDQAIKNRDAAIANMKAWEAAKASGNPDLIEAARKKVVSDDLPGDSLRTKLAIDHAMTNAPLTGPSDVRLVQLAKLMKDQDPSVALAAAWYLVSSLNPANTSDEQVRQALLATPEVREAYAKLQKWAKDPSDVQAKMPPDELAKFQQQVQLDAKRALDIVNKYGLSIGKTAPDFKADPIFTQAKAVLDSKDATLAQRKDAVELVVQHAMKARAIGNTELARACEGMLMQVAIGKDKELGRAVCDAVKRIGEQNVPRSEVLDDAGHRVIEWPNGTRTRVESTEDTVTYRYPDGRSVTVHYNDKNEVDYFQTSESGDRKIAGRDFAKGTAGFGSDGSFYFDDLQGMRTIVHADGARWMFYRGEPDVAKQAAELEKTLNDPQTSAEDKAKAILFSTSASNFDGTPVRGDEDPRRALLSGKLGMQSENAEVRAAAAQALLGLPYLNAEGGMQKSMNEVRRHLKGVEDANAERNRRIEIEMNKFLPIVNGDRQKARQYAEAQVARPEAKVDEKYVLERMKQIQVLSDKAADSPRAQALLMQFYPDAVKALGTSHPLVAQMRKTVDALLNDNDFSDPSDPRTAAMRGLLVVPDESLQLKLCLALAGRTGQAGENDHVAWKLLTKLSLSENAEIKKQAQSKLDSVDLKEKNTLSYIKEAYTDAALNCKDKAKEYAIWSKLLALMDKTGEPKDSELYKLVKLRMGEIEPTPTGKPTLETADLYEQLALEEAKKGAKNHFAARELMRKVLDIRQANMDKDDPELARAHLRCAQFCLKYCGTTPSDYNSAAYYAQKSLTEAVRILRVKEPQSEELAQSLLTLAKLSARDGDNALGHQQLKDAVDCFRDGKPANKVLQAECCSKLADSYMRQKKYDEACKLLVQMDSITKAELSDADRVVVLGLTLSNANAFLANDATRAQALQILPKLIEQIAKLNDNMSPEKRVELGNRLWSLSESLDRTGQRELAEKAFEQSLAMLAKGKSPHYEGAALGYADVLDKWSKTVSDPAEKQRLASRAEKVRQEARKIRTPGQP